MTPTPISAEAQIERCKVAEIFDDPGAAELFAEYTVECANPLLRSTAPQRPMYEALEGYGMAQCFTVREDGALRGFAAVIMSPLTHYGVKFATVESLFVARAARNGGQGWALMLAVEDYAREAGCKALFYSAPVNSQLARLLFLSSDMYTHTNHVFTRRLQ